MGKLKDQLAGIAALVAAIVAIGGGFVKYGEITTKLDALSESTPERSIEIEENSSNIIDNQQAIKVLQTQMQLINVRIRELQEEAKNPLGG
tara:strand:- start:4411 stop:4683 length:273 start_codon:yes stop_codon:yes gene_type:complete